MPVYVTQSSDLHKDIVGKFSHLKLFMLLSDSCIILTWAWCALSLCCFFISSDPFIV